MLQTGWIQPTNRNHHVHVCLGKQTTHLDKLCVSSGMAYITHNNMLYFYMLWNIPMICKTPPTKTPKLGKPPQTSESISGMPRVHTSLLIFVVFKSAVVVPHSSN